MKFKITQEKFEKIAISLLAITLYLTFEYFAIVFLLIETSLNFGAILFFLFITLLLFTLFISVLQEIGVVKFRLC